MELCVILGVMKRFAPSLFLLLFLAQILCASDSQVKNYMIPVQLKEGHNKVRIEFTAPEKHRIYTYRNLRDNRVTFYTASIGFIPANITVEQFDTGLDMVDSLEMKEIALDGKAPMTPLPADFKQILEYNSTQWRYSDWEVFSWESFPGILIIDFQNFNIQSHMLKRLSYFVEKRGYTGKIHSFMKLTGKTDWNICSKTRRKKSKSAESQRDMGLRDDPHIRVQTGRQRLPVQQLGCPAGRAAGAWLYNQRQMRRLFRGKRGRPRKLFFRQFRRHYHLHAAAHRIRKPQ